MSNKERLRLTDYIMKINDNIGLVVIDGIVDLASAGVNDEAESMALASKLLEWTSDNNCHVSIVLHENKNDRNAKGHLGSFLVQKSETTISLAKSEHTPSASDIVPEYTRNIEFPSMEMTITGYDTIELTLKAEVEAIAERVFTPEDNKRILNSLNAKTRTAAVTFIRYTENVQKKKAEKLLNEMESIGMFEWDLVGRTKRINTNGI
jgi:hypothetical protein